MYAYELARHLTRHGVAVVVDQALRGNMRLAMRFSARQPPSTPT